MELAGLSGSYHIPEELFTPGPEALYWEGSCPSEDEREAELVKLRARMSPPSHCLPCEECQYQFPLEKLIVHSKGLLCLDCFIADLAPGGPDDDDPQTVNLCSLRDYTRRLQDDGDRLTPLTTETALARWEAAINNVAIDDQYLAPGIIHQMRDALKSFYDTLDSTKLTDFPDPGQVSPIRSYRILWKKCVADLGTKGWADVMAKVVAEAN